MSSTIAKQIQTPNKDHLDGFFMGCKHMIDIAEQNKRGQSSGMINEMRAEYATLSLCRERHEGFKTDNDDIGDIPQGHGHKLMPNGKVYLADEFNFTGAGSWTINAAAIMGVAVIAYTIASALITIHGA